MTKEDGIYLRDLIPKKCSIDKREDNGGNGGNGNGGNGNGGNGNGGKDNGVSGKNSNNNNNKKKKKKKKGDPKSLTLKCYFTYRGSLTTPPCTQTIRWIVVKDYLLASTSQVCNAK